jgi:hypothetical protein
MVVTNKPSLLPDVHCFCTKTSSHTTGKEIVTFTTSASPLSLPSRFHTRKSCHRSCRPGEETLLPNGLHIVKLASAQFSRAVLVLYPPSVITSASLHLMTSVYRHFHLFLLRSPFGSFLYFLDTASTSRTFSTHLSNSLLFCWRALTSHMLFTGPLLDTIYAMLLPLSFLLSPLLIQHKGFHCQGLLLSTPSTIDNFLFHTHQRDYTRLVTLSVILWHHTHTYRTYFASPLCRLTTSYTNLPHSAHSYFTALVEQHSHTSNNFLPYLPILTSFSGPSTFFL